MWLGTIGFGAILLMGLCEPSAGADTNPLSEGKLIVIVTYGDVDNTPARNVRVYVHGYLPRYADSEKSQVLEATRDGQYEASLSPGLYDILVSEEGSLPRCKRVEINPNERQFWTLRLELDHEHLEKSRR